MSKVDLESHLPNLAELLLLLLLLESVVEDFVAAGLDVDLLGVTSLVLALVAEACSSSKSGLFKYSSKVLTSDSGAYYSEDTLDPCQIVEENTGPSSPSFSIKPSSTRCYVRASVEEYQYE